MKHKLPIVLFIFSLTFFAFAYGVIATLGQIFPYPQIFGGVAAIYEQFNPWFYMEAENPVVQTVYDRQRAYPGLNLVTCVGPDRMLVAKVIDMDGTELHRWDVDWFEIWPDAEHIPWRKPEGRPGASIHGAYLTREGDLIFNFEYLGLVRLAKDGEVMWRLPYQTHHSIYADDDEHLWVSGQIDHTQPKPGFPNYRPNFTEYTVLKVSLEGEILQEFSLFDVLKDNGLYGLLTMSTMEQVDTSVTGDTLHLNDVEVFPRHMKEGFFRHGDIMVSLRNLNAIFVMAPDLAIKYSSIGKYVRQHDPDFINGDTFSVFDNNNVTGKVAPSSRIVLEHAPSGRTEVVFQGSDTMPFFTDIMGKHQWLPNGNVLITETRGGRAFEIAPNGDMVWDYYNIVGQSLLGAVDEVERLPSRFDAVFR